MVKLACFAVVAAMLAAIAPAAAQDLSAARAREIIGPWYSLFNVATRSDVKAIQERVLTADYESCSGYLPGECWGRDTSIKVVSNFSNSIPDMKFDIKEVLVAGDRVMVRGEVTGTPAGDLFGVPHTGKSFRIMAIDIQTIRGEQDREDLSHGELVERARAASREVARPCGPRRSSGWWRRLGAASRPFGG